MEVAATMSVAPAPPPPPPLPLPSSPSHQRRPRVREVSSRFLTPLISPAQRRPKHQQTKKHSEDALSCSDENKPVENFETPFVSGCQIKSTVNHNNNSTLRRQRSVKLFKENSGASGGVEQQHCQPPPTPNPSKSSSGRNGNGFIAPSRPDTPAVTVPSRYRLIHQKSASINSSSATKLLQSMGIASENHVSEEKQSKGNVGLSQNDAFSVVSDTSSVCSDDDSNSVLHCSVRFADISSSSDGDLLPTVSNSNRLHSDRKGNRANLNNGGGDSLKYPASPCSRSLNFSSTSGEHQLFQSLKGNEKLVSSLSRSLANSIKGGICLPPVPPCAKLGNDTKKVRKGFNHQEDVHALKLLYNRYLQWRFSNAKAESSMRAKQKESERVFHSFAMKISEMYDCVKRKRVELELLQRAKRLSTILESQIEFLEEWPALEVDYAVSLSEVIQALLNASLRLPMTNNIKADIREMEEALNSAVNIMETIASSVHKFMPKAEEIHSFLSDLARVVGGERALIEECGDLLSETYKSQVEECSLRSHLMQLRSNNLQKQWEKQY